MPIVKVTDLGKIGLVSDIDASLVPINAWTEVKNCRFVNEGIEKVTGHVSLTTPSVAPYTLVPVIKGIYAYLVYGGLQKVYAWDGTDHTNITRQTVGVDVNYTGTSADVWNGGVLNGVLVLNNGVDDPQMWINSKLESLQWDSGSTWASKGYTAKLMRPYKNFLVALNWGDGTDQFVHSVYWSNQAAALSVPSNWDFADRSSEAGVVELAATNGYMVDGEQLRDQFIIYKEDSIHVMQHVGGPYVMQFRDLSKTTGVLAQRCAKEFYGKHFVFAVDDFVVTDGSSILSVANKRIRKNVFASIDSGKYVNSFVVRNLAKQEMWACFVEAGFDYPTKAAVWNWGDDTWSIRDLPANLFHMAFGTVPADIPSVWEGDTDTWDSETSTWNGRFYNPAEQKLFGCDASNIFGFDYGNTFNNAEIDSYATKEHIVLGDPMLVKRVTAIYPHVTGSSLQIYVGSKFNKGDGYSWKGPYAFDPNTDYKVDVRSTGRFHAVKFQFTGDTPLQMQSYDIHYEVS